MSTSSKEEHARASTAGRLNGWKEIAAYFGKGTRTVQRWERELGLPVRRVGNEVVYALTAELEAWSNRAEAERANRRDQDGTPGAEQSSGPASVSETPGSGSRARSWRRAGLALLLVTLLGVCAWYLRSVAVRPQPADVRIDVNVLTAVDAQGRALWSKTFRTPFIPQDYSAAERQSAPPVIVDDVDGDGRREVIFRAKLQDPSERGVYWFDHTGTEVAVVRPKDRVRFGGREFGPPWLPNRLFETLNGSRRTVWITWIEPGGEFPCLLQRLGPRGTVTATYWSSGYIGTVREALVENRWSVLVGATDNDHVAASLAVFDASAVGGTQPVDTSDKTCRDCPPGRPRTFLVFPRTDVSWSFGGLPTVSRLETTSGGGLRVFVEQGGRLPADDRPSEATAIYDFDASLSPLGAELSAELRALHARLQKLSILDHPLGERDREQLWPVQRWRGGTTERLTGPAGR